MLEIEILPVLDDNYVFVVHDPNSLQTAVVDPAVAEPVLALLDNKGWRLDYILNTHHHGDHIGGNMALKSATRCRIVGCEADKRRIPGIDYCVGDGESLLFGTSSVKVISVDGHTVGHVAYHFPDDKALFCGDTLFAMGCGRLFEGTAEQMWRSLQKIRALPEDTRIYCAHEYTLANGRFALSVEPNNPALRQRMSMVEALRSQGLPTIPSTLADELATNPFLRADSAEIRCRLDAAINDDAEVFAMLRQLKDHYH